MDSLNMSVKDSRVGVAVVYHILPHYRKAVFKKLDESADFSFDFFGSLQDVDGIKTIQPTDVRRFKVAPFTQWRGFLWQSAAMRVALSSDYRAIVFLSSPYFVSTWVGAAIAGLAGKKVIFWGHGWTRVESRFGTMLRAFFYRLSDFILVYADRARRIGIEAGFPERRIRVVYNSLDMEAARRILSDQDKLARSGQCFRDTFKEPGLVLIVCTARITPACRFDLLLDAVNILSKRGLRVNVALIGEGAELDNLKRIAGTLTSEVKFLGAIYDEQLIAPIIYTADLCVSPGKIGLTAIHALMYGTPCITHSDFDAQGPEVETIVEGETGLFFRKGDRDSLVDAIEKWLSEQIDRCSTRSRCIEMVEARWNPSVQAEIIEGSLHEALSGI
jgi:glycosyltransferase involved in cell wall biosynthesis